MFVDITHEKKEKYTITKSGEYIFYFENKNGKLVFDLLCPDATVAVYGLYRGYGNENFTLSITQNHHAPESESTVLIKSILDKKSVLKLTGTIHIAKNARKTTAHFTNRNLILNKKAHVITQPQLEVIPGDVTCTHAATTAPPDKDCIAYLANRGINEKRAKDLLIKGFADEILNIKSRFRVT